MAKLKDWIFKTFITVFVTVIVTMAISGAFGQNKKINEAASKSDVESVKLESFKYTDEALHTAKCYTDDKLEAQEKEMKAILSGIDGKLSLIISTQNAILKKEMGQ